MSWINRRWSHHTIATRRIRDGKIKGTKRVFTMVCRVILDTIQYNIWDHCESCFRPPSTHLFHHLLRRRLLGTLHPACNQWQPTFPSLSCIFIPSLPWYSLEIIINTTASNLAIFSYTWYIMREVYHNIQLPPWTLELIRSGRKFFDRHFLHPKICNPDLHIYDYVSGISVKLYVKRKM